MDPQTALTLIEAGLAQCRLAVAEDGGLLLALLTAGFVGGWSHCAGMCGPFVLAQVAVRLERIPAARMGEIHRLAGAAVLPYHLGRATTYAGLGATAAALTGSLSALPYLRGLSIVLLAGAALAFLAQAVSGLARWLPRLDTPFQRWWSARVTRLARPLLGSGPDGRGPVGLRGYALGLALGFIPCGLLYGALAAAAASGHPVSGALGMLAFTLGTMPSLFAVGLAGHVAGHTLGTAVRRAAPVIMAANAGVLGYLAWTLAV